MDFDLQKRIHLIATVMILLLGCLVLTGAARAAQTSGDLGGGFEYRRLDFHFGDFRGQICNQNPDAVDEFTVLFTAEDFRGDELWHTVVDIAGLGAGRCQGFLRSPDDFSPPFRLRSRLFRIYPQPLLPSGNLNLPFPVRGLKVLDRNLRAEFCNRSGEDLVDASLNLLGLGGSGEVVWRQSFPVPELSSGACLDVQEELDTSRLARNVVFNVLPVGPPAPLQTGEFEPGLSYDRLRVKVGRLRGEVCNQRAEESEPLLIKAYALRDNGVEAWSQSFYLPGLAPDSCYTINESIIQQSIRPSAWRFRVVRFE